MKKKKTITGVKKTTENYTGNVCSIIKRIIAAALALGVAITAAVAIKLFYKWQETRREEAGIVSQDNIKKVSFEDVQKIVEEYREAKKNNDTERIDELNREVSEGNYTSVLYEVLKEEIVRSLGLDPEKVEVYEARDGVFLIDKENAKKYAIVDHTGQINNRVKYIDKNGKNPKIPYEMRQMVSDLGRVHGWGRHVRMADLDTYYANFEYVAEYEQGEEFGER